MVHLVGFCYKKFRNTSQKASALAYPVATFPCSDTGFCNMIRYFNFSMFQSTPFPSWNDLKLRSSSWVFGFWKLIKLVVPEAQFESQCNVFLFSHMLQTAIHILIYTYKISTHQESCDVVGFHSSLILGPVTIHLNLISSWFYAVFPGGFRKVTYHMWAG